MNTKEILNERKKTHGFFVSNGITIQRLKDTARLGDSWPRMTEAQREAVDMILHKVGRIVNGDPFVADHWDDISGYAMLAKNSFTEGEDENHT